MKNVYQKILLGYLGCLLVYWFFLQFTKETTSIHNYLYSFSFSLMPLIGGFIGMLTSKQWGGLNSHLGKAVFFTSLGLFLWGSGSMVWSYYNMIAQISAPYPSLADLGFAPSVFFYGLGAVYLSRATGAKYGLRSKFVRVFTIIAALYLAYISYYILVVIARGGVLLTDGESILKSVLDVAYPLGDFVSVTIAVIVSGLSFKYFGGKYLLDIVSILIGLVVMFVADFMFSYTTTVGTFYNGNSGDLIFTLGLFFITYGVLGFNDKAVLSES